MSKQQTVRQSADTVEDNDLRLDQEKAEQIVDALNTELANSYVLYHQLKKHHWVVEGAEFLPLHEFLEEAYEHVEEGADVVAERAQALGGVPVSGPTNQEQRATVEFEGEDVYDVRTMLENDLEMYGDIIESMRGSIELADNLGDYATAELLREILVELEEDAHHFEHYLEDDTLVLEEATK
ncbi:DNA starvation/stationary phase protection protein DpsA [Natronobacterium gregoryi]|uniref:DNA starvation/stationary phase protection protein n=2 Tax=Natronobacterium gregoryi TaxID=44930 RepID=L0AKC8_NATGS|nr:DNA starvation/stationary phase protection protein DpsA [Natronobacterium gregoryi]AFZ74353.1 DNA-binding ferritin-like protein (oxidative damage protectant) [Natronobacterium gregoryi SP2]ELY63451.1 ferritin [Natronobacterium gregoryi SP2]PLK22137.1 DNA starvation/stationary phase protection protein [Natronobacterium gregoryi SP2]SFI54297.1 DNA-binding ferritin-like protein (oxidative damage protectant) [Natronobacterium gregoryi]